MVVLYMVVMLVVVMEFVVRKQHVHVIANKAFHVPVTIHVLVIATVIARMHVTTVHAIVLIIHQDVLVKVKLPVQTIVIIVEANPFAPTTAITAVVKVYAQIIVITAVVIQLVQIIVIIVEAKAYVHVMVIKNFMLCML